jgi:broad specificity phosphatase PhoE
MTHLILVRHGEATHNQAGRWEGWGSTSLTERGQHQAEALGRRLEKWSPSISHLYTSPIYRARQTAIPIARCLGLEAIEHDGLCEIDFGHVSGLTAEEFQKSMPELYDRWQDRGDLSFQFPGGEQRLAFFQRIGQALEEILARHPRQQVAIVAHGGTMRAGLAYLFPETMSDWWAYSLRTGSISHVRVGSDGNVLLSLNDCQHLDGQL